MKNSKEDTFDGFDKDQLQSLSDQNRELITEGLEGAFQLFPAISIFMDDLYENNDQAAVIGAMLMVCSASIAGTYVKHEDLGPDAKDHSELKALFTLSFTKTAIATGIVNYDEFPEEFKAKILEHMQDPGLLKIEEARTAGHG